MSTTMTMRYTIENDKDREFAVSNGFKIDTEDNTASIFFSTNSGGFHNLTSNVKKAIVEKNLSPLEDISDEPMVAITSGNKYRNLPSCILHPFTVNGSGDITTKDMSIAIDEKVVYDAAEVSEVLETAPITFWDIAIRETKPNSYPVIVKVGSNNVKEITAWDGAETPLKAEGTEEYYLQQINENLKYAKDNTYDKDFLLMMKYCIENDKEYHVYLG